MDYRVTTIIPVYNAEKYLEDTINSVIGQSAFNQVEVLLIDDGSTDCSSDICDRFSHKYENISVFHKENGGVSSARNYGLSKAKGQYIHFMDADDLISPSMYETFLGYAEQHTPDVIVGGVNRKNVIKNTCVSVGPEETRFYDEPEIADVLLHVKTEDERWLLDYIWNKFYLRSVIQDEIEFDTALSLGEDFDFNCRAISTVSSVMFVEDTVYDYTIRQAGLVTAFHDKPWLWRTQLFHSHISLYKKWGVLNSEREQAICNYEGMLDFAALRSINSERCMLSKSEKREHIEMMLESEAFDHILFYLQRCSGYKKILYRMMKKKNQTMVNLVIFMDRIMRK